MKLNDAEVTIRDLGAELDDTNDLLEQLQAFFEEAQAAATQYRNDLNACTRVHQLEIEAIKQEAENGTTKLRQTFNDSLEQTKSLLTSEMDLLRAKLSSKTRDLDHMIASEEKRRTELDSMAATVADLNQMLAEERAKTRQNHMQLNQLNARLNAQRADYETQIKAHEKVIENAANNCTCCH
jgi:hypothetical protein